MQINQAITMPSVRAADHFSQRTTPTWIGRILNFPLSRIPVIALFLMPVVIANSLIVFQVLEALPEPLASYLDLARMLLTIPLLIISYSYYCQVFEKREAVELSMPGAPREWLTGALIATCLVCGMVAILWLSGFYTIEEFRGPGILVKTLLVFSAGALLQDIVLLCIVFRLTEEFAGSRIALVVALLIFSVAHIANPNATLGSTIGLLLSSLIILGPFLLTRRLWMTWGFHASWNFLQAGVFGMPNSGIEFPGWIIASIDGPVWLTGGALGIEGSFVSVAADVAIGCGFVYLAWKRGQLVAPRWRRPEHRVMS